MNLEQRVAQLERQNRRFRRALIATVGGIVVVLGFSATGSFVRAVQAQRERARAVEAQQQAARAVQAQQQATQRMIAANENQ